MHSTRSFAPALIAVLATACLLDLDGRAAASESPRWCAGTGSPSRPCSVRVGRGPGGEVRSLVVLDAGRPLFDLPPEADRVPAEALPALRAYLAANQDLLFPGAQPTLAPEDFSELTAAAGPSATSYGLRTLRFEQRFRGVPVVGPAAELRLAVLGRGVYALTGAPLDPRRVLTGLGSTPEPARADVAMTRAVRDAGLAANPRALPSEWVAVPHRGTMGYKGTVVSDDEPPVLVAHVVLGADFKVIAVEPDRREVGGTVRANEMSDDPTTAVQLDHPGLPTLIPRSNEIEFDGAEARHAYRLGSDLRLGVVDFGGGEPDAGNAEFREELGGLWFAAPAPEFTSAGGDGFEIQDRYHKLVEALAVLDPLMAEAGWEHDAGIEAAAPPPIVRPAELLLLYDTPCIGASGTAPGITSSTFVRQAEQELLDLPHYSPWNQLAAAQPGVCSTESDCNANLTCMDGQCVGDPGFAMSTVNACTHGDPFVLFHEIGHYYERHAAYGFLSGVDGEQCVADSSDEATPLGESVASMTALYLLRRLYPSLPYTLDTLGSGCSFGPLDSRLGAVIHQDCPPGGAEPLAYARSFACERPDSSAPDDQHPGCEISSGYHQAGVFQAWWQLLNGQHCELEVGGGFLPQIESVSCTDVSTGPGYEDLWMALLLRALAQGNHQGYDELFDTIEGLATLVHWFYPMVIRDLDLQLLANVRENHSIGSMLDYPSPAFPGSCPTEFQP
jgi:hypothetical protein